MPPSVVSMIAAAAGAEVAGDARAKAVLYLSQLQVAANEGEGGEGAPARGGGEVMTMKLAEERERARGGARAGVWGGVISPPMGSRGGGEPVIVSSDVAGCGRVAPPPPPRRDKKPESSRVGKEIGEAVLGQQEIAGDGLRETGERKQLTVADSYGSEGIGDAAVATSRVNGAVNIGMAPHEGETGGGGGENRGVTLASTAASMASSLLDAEEEDEGEEAGS